MNSKVKIYLQLALYLLLFQGSIIGQNYKIGEWITEWYLAGPFNLIESNDNVNHLPGFEQDFLNQFGGENNFVFKLEDKINYGNEEISWMHYSSEDSIINMDEAVSKKSYITAYAYTELFIQQSNTYLLALGTNDGGILFVNDKSVWDYPGGRGLIPDEDLIPIHLMKGLNKFLLKIEEKGNKWEFCARLLPFDINEFLDSENIFNTVTLPNGKSELRFSLTESVLPDLFNSVNLEIYNNRNIKIWNGEWNYKLSMELKGLDQKVYEPYSLKIIAEKSDGNSWEKIIDFFSGEKKDFILFEDGKSNYKIVISKNASESEKWAANELGNALKEISGADFTVWNEKNELSNNEVIIGFNEHSKKLLGEDFIKPDPQSESFIYKNVKSNIILLGGEDRGTMYAVFSFLENELGVRWYTPEVTVMPKKNKYSFSYLDYSDKPSIRVRNDFYYEAFDPTWAAHNKINGAMGTRKQYGGIEGYWSVHTFYKFMPPDKYFDEHPEYYSLIEGERIFENAQLCLTNPDVLEIITEELKKVMRSQPENLIYSVSQNDWRNPCQCDNCKRIVRKENSESGIIVWFVNQVADKIKDEFPDKYVGTLAYQYTRKPPRNIKPKDNVVIRLCSIECCFAHDFKSCPENKEFLSDLEGWSAIAPHLYIWDYVVNFSHYILPYPNFNVLKPNIQTFQNNNAIGIMEQAAYQSRGGEFSELRAYLISKLLWNSDTDVEGVIDDFMYGYYGRSGQYIKEYFTLLHSQLTDDTHIHLGLKPEDVIFSTEFIKEANNIFDKAEIVAENNSIKERVEMARLPLLYLMCLRFPVDSKYNGTYSKFNEIVEREGITHFAESGKPHMEAFHNFVKNAE